MSTSQNPHLDSGNGQKWSSRSWAGTKVSMRLELQGLQTREARGLLFLMAAPSYSPFLLVFDLSYPTVFCEGESR